MGEGAIGTMGVLGIGLYGGYWGRRVMGTMGAVVLSTIIIMCL